MSDFPQGADWWKASNGLWYAPPATPDGAPPASTIRTSAEVRAESRAAEEKRTNRGCTLMLLGVVALIVVISIIASIGGDDDGGGDGPDRYGAYDVCKQFVEDRLRAPGTASFPNIFEDDGEVQVSGSGDVWTIRSHVDAENALGGEIRTSFVCQVRHAGADRWTLVDLSM